MRLNLFDILSLNLDDFDTYEKVTNILKISDDLCKSNSSDLVSEVILWGTEEVARRIYPVLIENGVKIIDVVDSNESKHGKEFFGHKIKEPYATNTICVLAAYEIVKLLEFAEKLIPTNLYISAWDILLLNPSTSALPWNNLRLPTSLDSDHLKKLETVSKKVLNPGEFWKQVASRHFIGMHHPKNAPSHKRQDEYFPDELHITKNNSIFLDLGAYTGDTIQRFFDQPVSGPEMRIAIAVEADRYNFVKLFDYIKEKRLNCYPFNVAIGNDNKIIKFSEQESSMGSSALFFDDNSYIPMLTIDSIFDTFPITHAKFDIEGFERFALDGARKTIKAHRTIWSIASYHLWDDLVCIPEFFLNSYNIFATSHANLPWDTTLHFVPNEQ